MRRRLWPLVLPVIGLSARLQAEGPTYAPDPQFEEPPKLTIQQPEPAVYALPAPQADAEGANRGGVNLDIKTSYFTNYIYRGINIPDFIAARTNTPANETANFQFDGKLSFDLGKLPHPFIGVFANVLDSDPVTNFEEVRPFFGAEMRIRPLILAAGNNSYIYPDRNQLNTAEVWGKITLDDAAVLHRDEPLLSPYIYGAYDYDLYNGWYFETGVSHDFVIENTPITITVLADVAYVMGHGAFAGPAGDDTGFHHYEVGVIGRYNLNTLLNIPQRLGQWSLNGYLYYVDGINDTLRSDTQLWGGVGIQLTY